jgi:hypothetical protein
MKEKQDKNVIIEEEEKWMKNFDIFNKKKRTKRGDNSISIQWIHPSNLKYEKKGTKGKYIHIVNLIDSIEDLMIKISKGLI